MVTVGVTSVLTCLDLKTGRVAWQRDLSKEFHVPQDFFGHGGTPLVVEGKVIVNVGGKEAPAPDDDSGERYAALAKPGLCVGAFDLKTGRMLWARQVSAPDIFGCRVGEANCGERPGPDFDFGSSPALTNAASRPAVVEGRPVPSTPPPTDRRPW